MSAGLEKTLRSLHESVSDSQPNREVSDILKDVDDIKQICVHEISDKDIDLTCGLLFHKDIGLLVFLSKAACIEALHHVKAAMLGLLSEFIQRTEKKILPYALDIKNVSVKVYSLDRFAKVKNAAIPVLIKLLELSAGAAMGKDLDIEGLIKKFFGELSKSSTNLTASVRANVYNLLGVIAEVFPDLMTPYAERLVGLYVGALKAEMTAKTKKPELAIIAGCLEGLTAFMLNFTQSIEEGSKHSYEIFKYARMAIDPNISYTKYDVPRAGLRLFARHAAQFKPFLMDEYRPMYEKLIVWSRHKNREVLHIGISALEAFVREISEGLVEKAAEGHKEGAVFKFFLMEFRKIVNSVYSSPKEVSMAIRGYGLLAAPCRTFLTESDVQIMFGEMIGKCEHQFFGLTEDMSERLMSVPSFLTALANIIRQVDTVPASHVLVLEKLIITLMENIPQVNRPQQFGCFKSILLLLLTLMGKSTVFPQLLESIVYQGLLRTCSHPILTDTEGLLQDTGQYDVLSAPQISYKDYISLWSTLLESAKIKELAADDFTIADRTQLTEAIYNQLMAAILKMLHKLDLDATITDETDTDADHNENGEQLSADPTYGVIAKKPKDFQVFINLVDFCKDLLVNRQCRFFQCWVYTFSHTLITMSSRHPLVSGFYKLLSIAMTIANKLDFFKDMNHGKAKVDKEEEMEIEGQHNIQTSDRDKRDTYLLIKKFSKEVLVRIKQYRDDLLASCLTLILSLPTDIIAEQMSDIVPAIQITFTIGLSYLPLVNIGLDALELWSQMLPSSILSPHYSSILPCLDAYLRTNSRDTEECGVEATVIVKSKSSARKSKAPVRLVRTPKDTDSKNPDSQLSQVKQRILKYLGSLGGQTNYALLAHADEDVSSEATAWDTQKHLLYNVPFFDMKPTIYFDNFLPQVVKLSQQSSDRQTKVAACELLHSLVLYCLGRGAHMPGQTKESKSQEPLYRKLFPPILALACDVEQVCKDLFEPLVMQLVHWFTSAKMAECPETMALLDCIFDGLIQGQDTALRDLSARCLREFLRWSLKQTTKKAAEKNPAHAKSVFKRIKSYALHPSSSKRFGASLAFNSIYMVFREEEPLVDRFTFEILNFYVQSLAMSHKDDKALGTQKQCAKVLDHLERIIRVKAELLKKDPGEKKRPEPSSWSSRNLEIALRWLTRQCGNPQTECRHACMKLVYNLCTLLPGVKTAKKFFAIFLTADGPQYFLKRFEGGGNSSSGSRGLLAYPKMHLLDATFTLAAALQWFDLMLAALDCYCWVFQEDLINPTQIFAGKGSEISNMFKSITYFVNQLAFVGIEGAARHFADSEDMVFTPREQEEYSRMKCTVIIRMWNFLTVLLAKHSAEVKKVVPQDVWSENLWKLLCLSVVQPTAVGFDMADVEIMQQLPKEMKQVLLVLMRFLPPAQMKQLNLVLSDQITTTCDLRGHLPVKLTSDTSNPGWHLLTQMAEGYAQLQDVGLLEPALKNAARNLPITLLDNVFMGMVEKEGCRFVRASLTPSALSLAKSLLSLSLNVGLSSDILVGKLVDKTQIEEPVGQRGEKVEQGSIFFTLMSPVINAHLASAQGKQVVYLLLERAEKDLINIGNIFVSLLDFVARDRGLRKREGPRLCQDILSEWTKLASCWEQDATSHSQSLAMMLLTKLLLIDSKCVSDPGSIYFKPVFDMYLKMLTDPRTGISFKNQVLDLLPFFASLKDKNEDMLKDALNRYIADNFPLKSCEFSVGTHQYNDYIEGINKLLVAMELSGSLMLLEILISIFCREPRHAHEDAIQAAIFRYVQRLPIDKQGPALNVPFSIFANESGFACEIRRSAIERVCLPLLRLTSIGATVDFFVKHIHSLTSPLDIKLNKNNESDLERQLTTKICCFQLLELMYARLPKEKVKSQTSPINLSFCGGKAESGNEMTQKITKSAQEAKSEDSRGETMLLSLRRLYHCHAYNLMMSIIACTQTELKFYKGFLFQDNVAKGQFLLDNVIDKDAQYDFEVELLSPLERRRKFVSIRSEARKLKNDEKGGGDGSDQSPGSNDSWTTAHSMTPSLHLASQYLSDSSLSDDVSKYDFSLSASAAQTSGPSSVGIRKASKTSAQEESTNPEPTLEENYVELEMDAINQHVCMAPVMALIKHMMDSKISPEVPKGTAAKEMPSWMPYLHEKLANSSTHINIKLFITKLIINCSQVFAPYAKFWLRPLCQLLFTPQVSDKGLNYFAVDLMVTMLSWHNIAIPEDTVEEKAMASRVVKFVVGSVYHHNRQVFRNNLELLRTMLECWHDRIELPYDIIYSMFKTSDPKSPMISAGVQVLGVVVTEKFPAFGPSAPVNRDSYLRSFFNLMSHRTKSVYAAAAEVTGLILRKMAEPGGQGGSSGQGETSGILHDYIKDVLLHLAASSKGNFIKCTHSIHKGCPSFTERLLSKLLFLLPGLAGEFKAQCLEVIMGHLDKLEDAYLELHSKGLIDFLSHRDEDTQLISLKIVKGMMVGLKGSELLSLMPTVASFSDHSSASCRIIMLNILQWVYDNYRDREDPQSIEIITLTKECLLRGLCDEDEGCRLSCHNFWVSAIRLPEGTLDRTVSVLEALYSAGTERHFLAYATSLLLEATSRSPDYTRPVFEHPLSECTFQDYTVHSSWRQRHVAMTPLFAATQMSQSLGGSLATDDQVDGGEPGGIRATQDGGQNFTATMDVEGGSKAFNWLTQSSLDTFAETISTVGGESQLLFRVGSANQGSSKSRVRGKVSTGPGQHTEKRFMAIRKPTGLKQEEAEDNVDGLSVNQSDVWRLKRRFLKDSDSQQIYHAQRNIRLKKLREEAVKEQRARRENQVTLYRKYRIGDFPDIQIKHQYLIAPLQALALKDNTIASLLFSTLFRAIFAEMDQEKTERQMEEIHQQINTSIEAAMSQSVLYFPPFIGSILTILYELRSSLTVPAAPLAISAMVSNQQILGIMVLEEQLIQAAPTQTSLGDAGRAKRPRLDHEEISQQTLLWIELSRLYKSTGEFDVLQGIFSDMLSTKDITRQAIDAEVRGDYRGAFKLYQEAMGKEGWSDGDPQEAEVDFWDDCRMECLNYLTDWKELETVSTRGIDDAPVPNLDRVWEDGFYQEHYLPYVIRSKLKLMLTGEDDSGSQVNLLPFLTEALKDETKKQHLQSRYCKELAQLFLWRGDYDTSRHYTSLSFESFLQSWSSTTTLMETSRRENLQNLQALVEQQEFLDNIASLESAGNLSPSGLARRWETRSPHTLLDPVTIWNDIVTNRTMYLSRLAEKMSVDEEGTNSQDSDLVGEAGNQRLAQMSARLHLTWAESCRQQGNFAVTVKVLKNAQANCKRLPDPCLYVDWVHLYAKTHQSKARSMKEWTDDTFNNVGTTLDQLAKVVNSPALLERSDLAMNQRILTAQSLGTLADGLLTWPDIGASAKAKLASQAGLTNTSGADNDQIVAGLIQKGFQSLKAVASVSDIISHGQPGKGSDVMPCDVANLELAKFCDKYLHQREDGKIPAKVDLSQFPTTVVVCMLTAIKGGVFEARQRFPRLLQIAESYPEVKDVFIRKASEIPSWMFLMWVSQMTAVLDKAEAVVVAPLLLRIGSEYPQALIYPFRMSSDGYAFGSAHQDKKNQETVKKLESLSNIPLVNKFICALEQFGQPDMIFMDWVKEVKKFVGGKRDISKSELRRKFNDVVGQIFDVKASGETSSIEGTQSSIGSQAHTIPMGNFYKKFAMIFKDEFFKSLGKNGEKLASMTQKEFSVVVSKMAKLIADKFKQKPPEKIKDYCSWMADFNPNKDGDNLEIPGQYGGLVKPMPEYHVKIAGFDERVLVLKSLRMPKRITIRGNDEKDYPYLVKSGEDLRMDQRIETLFFIMNCVMDADPTCRQRKLHLKTYQVISMTPRVGLIEWMRNTQTLKEFLFGALSDDERRFVEGNQAPGRQHGKWVEKIAGGKTSWQGKYDSVYTKYSYSETVKEFKQKEGKMPWDLSRRALHKMSSSPEAFHVLRSAMLKSHSVISICQYILGLGDRHLSNFMVNLKTGHMVGIDFGHNFGSATQFLPVPELMPFRLTRQLTNLNMPLKVKGQMESCMRHTLRALRADSNLLLSTMDVFVKEPSLDWTNFAEKQMQEGMETDDAMEDAKWYPKQKIQFAERKLKGDHPCYIMKDELELGHSKREVFKHFVSVLMGRKQDNVRTELPSHGLTVEQQVAALIDHATDPNILGRTWGGWEPWV